MAPSKSSSSPNESIKQGLSLEVCSASTVRLLTDALFASLPPPPAAKVVVSTKSRSKSTVSRTKKITTTTTETVTVAVSQCPASAERYKLAIEVINACFRGLSEAAKKCASSPASPPPRSVSKEPAPTRKTGKLSSSTSTRPLQSRSLNRNDTPPSIPSDPIVHLANCCSIAISYLQSIQGAPDAPEFPPLQVENAQSNLVAKLLSLEMYDLALKESRSLKRRLEDIMDGPGMESWLVDENGQKVKVKSRGADKMASAGAKSIGKECAVDINLKTENVARLLEFKNVLPTNPAFPLVMSYQVGVLKCIAGLKRPEIIEAILPSLSLPNSPLALVKILARASASKALTHLNTLNFIFSTSPPSISPAVDAAALNPKISCSPKAALILQTMSIECAVIKKFLSPEDRSVKQAEDQWEVFRRYLSTYVRRTQDHNAKRERYIVIRDIVDKVRRLLHGKDVNQTLPFEILKIFSTASSEAGLVKESMKWAYALQNALEKSKDPSDEVALVACKIKLAVMELKISSTGPDGAITPDEESAQKIEDAVRSAVHGLTTIGKGRKADLETLLQEVGYFRRSGLSLLAVVLREDREKPEAGNTIRPVLKKVSDSIMISVIAFCRKYHAMGIQPEEMERMRLIVLPAIDTAISRIWRNFDVTSSTSWEESEALIKDCYNLIGSLRSEEGDEDAGFYEKVSNAYWQIHLLYRKSDMGKQSVLALRRSIAVLETRPAVEQESSNMALKWERLASFFLSIGDYKKAEEAFRSTIAVFITTGVLEELGHAADRGDVVKDAFDDNNQEEAAVGRVLVGLVKCAIKRKGGAASELRFDDEGLSGSARGLLLEWSFRLAVGVMGNDGSVVRAVGERLLDIYTIEEFPVRRARIVARLLGLAVDHTDLLNRDEVKAIGEEIAEWAKSEALGDDWRLKKYKDDVVAGCLLSLAFLYWQDEEPRPDLVKIALGLWSGLVEKTGDWEMMMEVVEDIDVLIRKLEMLVEFLDMKGEAELRICVLRLMLEFRGVEEVVNFDALIKLQSLLGLQYLRLGYSGKAGMALAKAQALVKKSTDVSTETLLRWHLAYTEYLVDIGNLEKGSEHFASAYEIVENDQDLVGARKSGVQIAKRVKMNRIIADAAYVMSLMSFEQGNLNDSLTHARRCVRLNQRAWAGLECLSKDAPKNNFAKSPRGNAAIEGLTEGLEVLSTKGISKPKVHSTTFAALNIPLLWPLVNALYLGLVQTSALYRHQGMIREAEFYLEQALKTVEAVDASRMIARAMVLFGDLRVRANMDGGEEMLEDAGKLVDSRSGREGVELEVAVANLERGRGDFEEEFGAYGRAEERLEELMEVRRIEKLGCLGDAEREEDLERKMANMEIKESAPKTKAKLKTLIKRKPTSKPTAAKVVAPKTIATNTTAITGECSSLLKMKGDVLRAKSYNLAMQCKCDEADALLEQAAKLPAGHQELVSQGLAEAKNLLHDALALIASDPVFSVMQDSTISIPSVAAPKSYDSTSSPVKKSTRKPISTVAKHTKEFLDILSRARDCVFEVHARAVKMGSSTMTHSVASLLSGIVVMLSAVTASRGKGADHPLFASYSLELHKGLSLQREKAAIEAEKLAYDAPEDLSWPNNNHPSLGDDSPFEFSTFQRDYIDVIPKKWAAVSISLSENKEELYISRFQAGQSQLMVRLPLTRHNSRDDFEDIFEYETGLAELKEIIVEANTSAHEAKEMTSKGARSQWWQEREALDSRLKDLLTNVEHVWLGGFKGIFSQYSRHPELLARFRASFDRILGKYLPSRKRRGKAGRVVIDYRILELFIGLGSPENQELVEPMVDLIYFVVDILQFHGEGNAYDEIDVDAMVIEMIEALASYHEEASFHSHEAESEIDHTILILDKSVHMFPWESLPCLRGHSVSRLPSLVSLRERILMMQEKTPTQPQPGFYINKSKGCYILNPSSDLKNTQKVFEEDLKKLNTWTGIVERPPSEKEFKSNLEKQDLMLYFGHGSGAHFIRARTVKKLDKCAVSLLLGCSSGALKDAGEYEPYGMPVNYLLGGCPALVATLWDVTDKDIDRFSKDVFETWGLFTDRKGKGRELGDTGDKQCSLVEAVRRGREKCVLRYLNGAAPVVYGIPAYLM